MMNPPTGPGCLHLVVSSSLDALQACRAQCAKGDTVFFLDAGVMHLAGTYSEWSADLVCESCFSAIDLDARGLHSAASAAGVSLVTDIRFCELLASHEFCLTWK